MIWPSDGGVSVAWRLHGRHPYDGCKTALNILWPFRVLVPFVLNVDGQSCALRPPLTIPGLLFVVTDESGVGLDTVTVGYDGHWSCGNRLFRFFLLVLAIVRRSLQGHGFLPVRVAHQTTGGQ